MKLRIYHLVLIVIASLVWDTRTFAQVKIQPYSAKIAETTKGLISGTTLEKFRMLYRRSDGSTAKYYLDANGALLAGQIRELVLIDQAKKLLIDDVRKNVTTLLLNARAVERLAGPRTLPEKCAPRTFLSNVEGKGVTTLPGGLLAYGYRFPDAKSDDASTTLEVWLAPAMDCLEVGQTATRTDRRFNQMSSTYERRLLEYSDQEPPPNVFEAPLHYAEVKPSTLYSENLTTVNKMQPSKQMLDGWAKGDQEYEQSRAGR